jgi:hypothetical protein
MRWLILLALGALALATPARADRLHLLYEGRAWGVAPLGEAVLDFSLREDGYRVGARLDSGGLLKLFDNSRLTAEAEGGLSAAGPVWARYDLDHAYAKKRRVTAMRYDGQIVNVEVDPIYRNLGEPPASEEQKRAARDPLSSILAMGMQVARTRTCEGAYATFDGRHLYNLTFAGGKPGRYDTDGYDGPVLKCNVRYEPVAGFEKKQAKESRKKTPKAEIWFALTDDPAFAPPVKIELPLGLGRASISLKQMRRAVVAVEEEAPAATN